MTFQFYIWGLLEQKLEQLTLKKTPKTKQKNPEEMQNAKC